MASKKPAKSTAARSPAKAARKRATDEVARPAGSASEAVDEQLARYRSMRDFAVTAEPAGSGGEASARSSSKNQPFCVQKHAASHLHYDFRLGWNGVLKSWACAKGPSYVVADKRLAVQVEDHPMEYGGFEGIIPAGQYGGGTVMLWDQGSWEPQAESANVGEALRKGMLKFVLRGTKLQGKWALIRMAPRSGEKPSAKPNWLLIKEHDDHEQPADAPAITDASPDSVVTGRSIEQIAASEDHVWNSKDTAASNSKDGKAWYSQPDKAPMAAVVRSADIAHLPKEAQPAFLEPQLAQQAEMPPTAAGWLHELKLDGYRIQARKGGGKVQLFTRTGLDWTHRMPALAAAVARIPVPSVTFDGEAVVLCPDGSTSFADLQAAFQNGAKHHLTYFVFDLLHIDGRNPRGLPLRERKELLVPLLAAADSGELHLSEHLESDGPTILRNACKLHAEGIVSKLATAKYSPGRSASWIKCKCLHEQEFVVGGFTLPAAGHAGMHGVGALLLGYYDHTHKPARLIYAGRTGTGFTQKTHKLLRDKLEELAVDKTAFDNPPAEARRGAHWVRPELVAQVRFATWTADSLVRQAAFLGLREDKPAVDVTRDTAAPKAKSSKPSHSVEKKPMNNPATSPAIRLTHPDKVLDPDSGLTKQQLADYYLALAPSILPHIAGRPLSLVRCPEGCTKPCFFQKHVNAMLPKTIGSIDVPDKKTGKPEPYITLSGASATPEVLASLAQLGVLEIHPWSSSNSDLEHPDRLIFDLDPDERLPWSTVASAALDVRARLKQLGLTSFLKTTGGKGLHVVVPIEPTLSWSTAKGFAHAFVLAMERDNAALYLTKMTKSARAGRIYLDYLRNERGATAVAPYSPRARAGAPVSVPLTWSEIEGGARPGAYTNVRPVFTIATLPEWQARIKKEPWKLLTSTQQGVTSQALDALNIKA